MTAPEEVQAAVSRIMPVAELLARAMGRSAGDIEAAREVVRLAMADGLTRSQCVEIHERLQDAGQRAAIVEVCDRLGMDGDTLVVLDWIDSEIAAGGTRAEPAPVAQPVTVPAAPVLMDCYTPPHGVPHIPITCLVWDQTNNGTSSIGWRTDRYGWPSHTLSNGKMCNGRIVLIVVKAGGDVFVREMDKIKGDSKDLGNVFREPPEALDADNPYRNPANRPQPGDQWTLYLTDYDRRQRTNIAPLAVWR